MEKNLKFDTALAKLAKTVEKLESGELSLEESMKLYEEGNKLAAYCYKVLSSAEQKLITIDEVEADQ